MLQEIKSDVKLKFANQIEFYECTYEWNDWEVNDALEVLNTIENFDTRFEQQLSFVSLIKLKQSIRDNYVSRLLDQCYPGIHVGELIRLLEKLNDRHCKIQPQNINSLLRKAVEKDDYRLCLQIYKYWPTETEVNESKLEAILKKLEVKSDLETAIELFIEINPEIAFLSLAHANKLENDDFSVLSQRVFDKTENLLQSYSYTELLDEIKKMAELSEENKSEMIEDLIGALINLDVKFDTKLIELLDSNYILIKYRIDLLKKYGIDNSHVNVEKLITQINDYWEGSGVSSEYLIAIGLLEIQNGRTDTGI